MNESIEKTLLFVSSFARQQSGNRLNRPLAAFTITVSGRPLTIGGGLNQMNGPGAIHRLLAGIEQ